MDSGFTTRTGNLYADDQFSAISWQHAPRATRHDHPRACPNDTSPTKGRQVDALQGRTAGDGTEANGSREALAYFALSHIGTAWNASLPLT